METTRKYKRNPGLIALGAVGGLCAVIWVVSNFVFTIEILSFELAGQEVKFIVLLYFIIMLLSGQLVYSDAAKIDAGEAAPEQKTFRSLTWSPASWGVLVFFLWIIMFPYYLYKREEIYWQNITVEYSALKTIEREITTHTKTSNPHPQPKPPKKEYSENVGTCPTCDTPYPIRMLERSKICNRCGKLLVQDEE
jgi:hypothetical protein